MTHVSLCLALGLALAGCSAPPTAPTAASPSPIGEPTVSPIVTLHNESDPGIPPQKRAIPLPEWLPDDHLAYDASVYVARERAIHGTRVVVAVHEGIAGEADAFAELLFAAFDDAWHVFGGFPGEEIRVVARGPDEACAFRGATAAGFVVCYQDHAWDAGDTMRPPHPLTERRIPELVIHELLHAWNGGVIQPTPRNVTGFLPEAWWIEGATEYHAATLSGDAERAMAAQEAKFERACAQACGLNFSELAARTPPPGDGSNAYVDMLYARGALVARALDAELARHGAGLGDVHRALYLDALEGTTFETRDIQAIAEREARAELDAFFDAYVWGAQTPPQA